MTICVERSRRCSKIVQLSWRQALVLEAAERVDYLPFRAQLQVYGSIPYGVWRSLVGRGLLRHVQGGWEITDKGRTLVHYGIEILNQQRKERLLMDGKLPRYCVSRTLEGWAVVDRSNKKIRMHNDVVETFRARDRARDRARELNLQEQQEKLTSGDAA